MPRNIPVPIRFLLLATVCLGVPLRELRAGKIDAERSYAQLRELVGTWEARTGNGKAVRVRYRLISAGSVMVEDYAVGSGRETMTVYHLDGARLIATHYCAQGNQPRLALQSGADQRQEFDFLDATNLADPEVSHLQHLVLQRRSDNELDRIETYRSHGKDDVAALHLIKVADTPN